MTKIRIKQMKQRIKRTQKRSIKLRWVFEKINKIDKPLGSLTKKKKEGRLKYIKSEMKEEIFHLIAQNTKKYYG